MVNQLIEQDEDGLVDCKGVSYDPLDSSDIQYTYPLLQHYSNWVGFVPIDMGII